MVRLRFTENDSVYHKLLCFTSKMICGKHFEFELNECVVL
jgi:hypothetical protein